MSKERIIESFEYCRKNQKSNDCENCEYGGRSFQICEQMADDILVLLKEREAVKPIRDKKTGRVWLCGNCGSYVGFEDHDENDPNEFDKYCRECGRPVLWEGR